MLVKRFSLKQRSFLTVKSSVICCVLTVFLLTLLFLPSIAGAQGTDRFGLEAASGMGLGTTDLIVMISNIVRIILGLLGILAVLIIMYAGFVWMTASGDPDKVVKAKKVLVSAIIGLVIIMSSFIIASFIISSLTGGFGGGGGGGRGPGDLGDLGRWGIGRGPIESVYPEPNANNVPINTRIIVTFKEQIKSDTICDAVGDGGCDNNDMKNVEICEMDDDGECVADDAQFGKDAFVGSKVKETADKRTFVFVPSSYLGAINEKTKFKVTLKKEIRSVANPDNSIFHMLSGNQYAWAFTTSGKLDLDPPEIKDLTGVYPYPDDSGDDYEAGAPVPSIFTVSIDSALNAQQDASISVFSANNASTDVSDISSSGTYDGEDSGSITVDIASSDGNVTINWPGDASGASYGEFTGVEKIISDKGLDIVLGAQDVQDARGNSWTANLQAAHEGDKLEIKKLNDDVGTLIYGRDISEDSDLNKVRKNIVAAVIDDASVFESVPGDPYSFKTKLTGDISRAYTFTWLAEDGSDVNSYIAMSSSGSDGDLSQTISGRKDPFRNTIFQITFNEAIDPTLVDNLIIKKEGVPLIASEYQIEMSNQYRTVELRGGVECGVNSCGDKIYCWPIVGGSVDATPYSVEIKAAKLAVDDPRCASWGGAPGSNGRCQKIINTQTVFYPVAESDPDGVIDLCGNSFNGSFDYYEENNSRVGNAQGQSGSGDGTSGRPAYILNSGMQCEGGPCSSNSSRIVSYGSSEPVNGVDGFGDDFNWSFFLSPEVDTQAPLANTISPIGDQEIFDANQPIAVAFDRLMRGATLRPGYNYGSTAKNKSLRYLVLDVVTKRVNPAGYWVSREEVDINGDGWADKSVAQVKHNVFGADADYSFLAGSGIESITQNCFLPSGGPQNAGNGACIYDGEITSGCVRDDSLGNEQVKLPNPASYGKLDCKQIAGTDTCETDEICQVLYFDKNKAESYLTGSWVITDDFGSAVDGRTGCCFGKCVGLSAMKTCEQFEDSGVADVCLAEETCQADPANNLPGYWIRTKNRDFVGGRTDCCFGKCAMP